MTDRYFDWYNGSDSNDGLTPSTPKKSYNDYRAGGGTTAGDRIFTKRGTPQYFTTLNIDVKSGSSDSVRTLYGAYGEEREFRQARTIRGISLTLVVRVTL